MTYFHSKFFGNFITLKNPNNQIDRLGNSILNASIDLNPHQVDGALFYFNNPLTNGVILADEVGLGKTIEAGLILSQLWAEYRRKILLIVPASLRKQWVSELEEKFFIDSIILEGKSYKDLKKKGVLNPFEQDKIVICSFEFVAKHKFEVSGINWNLIVIDEAHKLRNVYRKSNRRANEIKNAINSFKKLLLTATPLQNSLLELYGLVSFIDEYTFGDLDSFKKQFVGGNNIEIDDLRYRMKKLVHRTLRKQVLEYIKYTNRIPITQEFEPSEKEQKLYEKISEFLKRDELKSINNSQKHLIILILRKLLASSSRAIAGTLDTMINRLEDNVSFNNIFDEEDDILEEYEELEDNEGNNEEIVNELKILKAELQELKEYRDLAYSIEVDKKTESLLIALDKGFNKLEELGANKKVLIFTESRRTQDYLKNYLENHGYKDKVVLFNGTNNSKESREIYNNWLNKHQGTSKISGSKSSDMRASLVDHFKDEAEIMIATESASEGVNLQFCSLLINYDMPWNPQRIEQRIGRVHRYGQKFDVIVINFLNIKNKADMRVYELLNDKFQLFSGVFGTSDEVLGSIEDGVDFEKRILNIYQQCRTDDEINLAFDSLQKEMETEIKSKMKETRQKIMENFDEEVAMKLKSTEKQSLIKRDIFKNRFYELTKIELGNKAEFDEKNYFFLLKNPPINTVREGKYTLLKDRDFQGYLYRTSDNLGEYLIGQSKNRELGISHIVFDTNKNQTKVSIVESFKGKSGYLRLDKLTIETFDNEEYLIFSGFDDNGKIIESEILEKFFNVIGEDKGQVNLDKSILNQLEQLRDKNIEELKQSSLDTNSNYFNDEIKKLEKWTDDMKVALEKELKELKKEFKDKKMEALKQTDMKKRLEMEKEAMKIDDKYKRKQKEYFVKVDEIDDNKWKLIEDLEKRMTAGFKVDNLFIIKWFVV